MKILSLTQPWSSLVALSAKRIETRSWSTPYRGPLGIHAAKTFPVWARDLCATSPFREALATAGVHSWRDLEPTLGHILACRDLYDVESTNEPWTRDLDKQERAFGDYTANRYGLFLRSVVPLNRPIRARGALGLWEYPLEAELGIEVTA